MGENGGKWEEEEEADGEGIVHHGEGSEQQELKDEGEALGHVPVSEHCSSPGGRERGERGREGGEGERGGERGREGKMEV